MFKKLKNSIGRFRMGVPDKPITFSAVLPNFFAILVRLDLPSLI